MDLGIAGRRAAVAAASAGLGFATAEALAAEGVAVAICSRDPDRIRAAAERIGRGAVPLVADVSDPEAAGRFVAEAAEALGGPVDILVTNAGGPPPGGALGTDVAGYERAVRLNLLSTVAMCSAAVPAMRRAGWGRVVAITSIAVRQPPPNLAASATARAGVTAYLKVLAREVAADGVTVNSVQPGLHDTERVRALGADPATAARTIPAGRMGTPGEFGRVVAFLCSEHAGFITGASIPVDGGAYPGLL